VEIATNICMHIWKMKMKIEIEIKKEDKNECGKCSFFAGTGGA